MNVISNIEGIDILTSHSINTLTNLGAIIMMFSLLLVGLLTVVLVNTQKGLNFVCNHFLIFFITLLLVFVGITLPFLLGETFQEHYIEYKATISPDVTLDEIYSQYEIVEIDGRLYTLRDKEVEEAK